jgi:class 3 adenylate cyclase/tetratricopeptide (TPR) repeat protein
MSPAVAITEERKTVTTLFCDLVAFTAMSEAADPEDVDHILSEYFSRATRVIESHGGTVEKFIGDAVVGVFGVPAVHEDDPERAVRAALRILEALEGMTRPDGTPLEARCGVNTGEALVRLDVDPISGRGFLTGDAVNTAARLETAAPPMGVVVGQLSHDLTIRAIVYEELPPVAAKGKAEPVAAWLATGRLARRGLELRSADLTPLVGREVELAYLSAIFDKTLLQAAPQFVLIVGEPGIGKSRLVRELSSLVDSSPQMIVWRQGYCPPFGEDVTYGALVEIVKGHFGIRDDDPVEVVDTKLRALLPEASDRGWLAQRVRALLGLEATEASRQENFAAWMRFFEHLANAEPSVLVFEDLHWADDALLAFIEHLTVHLAAVPLLMVGTARPELLERRPGFAATGPVARINLGPLSPAEMTLLVAGLLGEPEDRANAVSKVLERCEGNPFFAEQSARFLADTSLQGSLPDSVQAVIAARLDGLPATEKSLLADASVIGGVFWGGAAAAVADCDPEELESSLTGLLQRQLIRRLHESSLEGEREFAFVHALAREVAYRELPRGVRARKHAATARWLEKKLDSRGGDAPETLAHHYGVALDLAMAIGDVSLADELRDPAIESLRLAGDRAMRLDVVAAEQHYSRALALLPEDDPRRAAALRSWGWSLLQRDRHAEAAPAFQDAAERYRAQGRNTDAALALNGLGIALTHLGRPWHDTVDEMLGLIGAEEASPEKAEVVTAAASVAVYDADYERGIALLEQVRGDYAQLGKAVPATVAFWEAQARCGLGDAGAPHLYREALGALIAEGHFRQAGLLYINSATLFAFEGPLRPLAFSEEGLQFAAARGMEEAISMISANRAWFLYACGIWDEALSEYDRLDRIALEEQVSQRWSVRLCRAQLLARMGRTDEAVADVTWAEQRAKLNDAGVLADYASLITALVLASAGSTGEATNKLAEVLGHERPPGIAGDEEYFPWLSEVALRGNRPDLVERVLGCLKRGVPLCEHVFTHCSALLAEHNGDLDVAVAGFARATAGWREFGMPYEAAQALLGRGRCLMTLSRNDEAVEPLAQARGIFERLGAKPALEETDTLIVQL